MWGIKVTKNALELPLPLPILAFFVFINLHLKDMGPIWIFENLYFICLKKNFSLSIHLKKIDILHAKNRLVTNQPLLIFRGYAFSENECIVAFCGSLLFLKIKY